MTQNGNSPISAQPRGHWKWMATELLFMLAVFQEARHTGVECFMTLLLIQCFLRLAEGSTLKLISYRRSFRCKKDFCNLL